MLSVGTIVGGGFRLLREHAAAVAVWMLLYLVTLAVAGIAMRPLASTWMGAMGGGDPQLAIAQMAPMLRWFFLIELGLLMFFVVLIAAPLRAVLRPEEPGFFYLRLGMDELHLFGIVFLFFILLYAGMLLGMIPIGLLAVAAYFTAGPVGAVSIAFLGFFAYLGILIWLQVRFSLILPLTVLRRRIIIGESWRLTRGHFWTLFAAYLVIVVILLAASSVLMMVSYGPYLAAFRNAAQSPEAIREAQQQMMTQMGTLSLTTLLTWALTSVVGVFSLAFGGGAIATATLQLTGGHHDISETFA